MDRVTRSTAKAREQQSAGTQPSTQPSTQQLALAHISEQRLVQGAFSAADSWTRDDLESYLNSLDIGGRKSAVVELLRVFTNISDQQETFAVMLWEYISNDPSESWKAFGSTESISHALTANSELARLKKVADQGIKTSKAKRAACQRIVDYRGRPEGNPMLPHDAALLGDLINSRFSPLVMNGSNSPLPQTAEYHNSRDLLTSLATIVTEFTPRIAVRNILVLISSKIYDRINQRSGGSRAMYKVTNGDLVRVLGDLKGGAKTTERFKQLGYKDITSDMWKSVAVGGYRAGDLDRHPYFQLPCLSEHVRKWNERPMEITGDSRSRAASVVSRAGARSRTQSPSQTRILSPASVLRSPLQQRGPQSPALSPNSPRPRGYTYVSPHGTPFASLPADLPNIAESLANISVRNEPSLDNFAEYAPESVNDDPGLDYDKDDDYHALRRMAIRGEPCKCSSGMPASIKRVAMEKEQPKTPHERWELAKEVGRAAGDQTMCAYHKKLLLGKIGLQTRAGTLDLLMTRVREFIGCADPVKFMTATGTYLYFRLEARPKVKADFLGVYAYLDYNHPFQGKNRLTKEERGVLYRTFWSKAGNAQWEKDGTILDSASFGYWKERVEALDPAKAFLAGITKDYFAAPKTSIQELAFLESKMYLWHQREINGKPNLGWNRTMYHSLPQQVMRQSLEYWLKYVSLRPDGRFWLVSYPYYGKMTRKDDRIEFSHIDINIKRYLEEGRGASAIQGSLTLQGESDDNCTWIIKGMHNEAKMRKWYQMMVDRRCELPGGFVSKITNKHWTDAEKATFKTDWTRQVAGDCVVRISSPTLPHGSRGTAPEGHRITWLPWFCGIEDDHSTLEMEEGGTWEELAAAHRDLIAGPATPSGHSVNYGRIPYAFPAAVEFVLDNPVSKALVGRMRWDNIEVMEEARRLLTDMDYAAKQVAAQKKEVQAKYAERFVHVMRAERNLYKQKSFVNYLLAGSAGVRPTPDHIGEEGTREMAEWSGVIEVTEDVVPETGRRSGRKK